MKVIICGAMVFITLVLSSIGWDLSYTYHDHPMPLIFYFWVTAFTLYWPRKKTVQRV
ncbi:hypothetical protein J3L18_11210 [Mucilaginibacter gossypii]|uniref:hypothetical protein n=1 Tax=Mucilaginibacter gossypii TaxID=551996 RepID=UPI0016723D7D|nr:MULTISPECIES: hypothetical protein [Mucilaginibacter]QTE39595.1 hypothetical protein J3L18_11210 [Mucilaginibacter gossypii]